MPTPDTDKTQAGLDTFMQWVVLTGQIESVDWTLYDNEVDHEASPPVLRLPEEYIVDLLMGCELALFEEMEKFDAEEHDAMIAASLEVAQKHFYIDPEPFHQFIRLSLNGESLATLCWDEYGPEVTNDLAWYLKDREARAKKNGISIMIQTEYDKMMYRRGRLDETLRRLVKTRVDLYNAAATEHHIKPLGEFGVVA